MGYIFGGSSSGSAETPDTEADVSGLVADLALKAPLASPTFTGTPAAPTAAQGTNTTQLATTAMVHSEAALLAPLASPTFSGTPSLPTGTTGTTQSAADGSTKLATTLYTDTADNLKANLASPTFSGTPSLPTGTTATSQAALDRSTKLATTLYTDRAIEQAATASWSFPTGAVAQTFDRSIATGNTRTASSGNLFMTALYIPTGVTISNFNAISNVTSTSGTHCWFALFNSSRVMLAITADDTSAGPFTGSTAKTQAVATIASGASATFVTTYTGLYYVGLMVAGTGTMPTIRAIAVTTDINGIAPIMGGNSNGSQTTPQTFAFTANAITVAINRDYIWLT